MIHSASPQSRPTMNLHYFEVLERTTYLKIVITITVVTVICLVDQYSRTCKIQDFLRVELTENRSSFAERFLLIIIIIIIMLIIKKQTIIIAYM